MPRPSESEERVLRVTGACSGASATVRDRQAPEGPPLRGAAPALRPSRVPRAWHSRPWGPRVICPSPALVLREASKRRDSRVW